MESYKLEKHRRLELKHFCLQYEIWKGFLNATTDDNIRSRSVLAAVKKLPRSQRSNVAEIAIMRATYSAYIKMVEDAAKETDEVMAPYILQSVATGLTYEKMHTDEKVGEPPCSREYFNKLLQRFFWLLDEKRG